MRTKAKKKLLLVTAAFFTGFLVVTIKLSYVMIAQADKYLYFLPSTPDKVLL